MSRSVKDVEAVFGLAFERGAPNRPVAGLTDLLTALNVVHIFCIGSDGSVEAGLYGLSADPPEAFTLEAMADAAAVPPSSPQTSPSRSGAKSSPAPRW